MKTLAKLLAFLMVWGVCGMLSAQDETPVAELKAQSLCPVEGNPVSNEIYVDVNGKRIYACCQECCDKIGADPEAALEKIASAGEIAEDMGYQEIEFEEEEPEISEEE